jgi:hypothetical protein
MHVKLAQPFDLCYQHSESVVYACTCFRKRQAEEDIGGSTDCGNGNQNKSRNLH